MQRTAATTQRLEQQNDTSAAGDHAANEARAWVTRSLRWERRLAELHTEYAHAHTTTNSRTTGPRPTLPAPESAAKSSARWLRLPKAVCGRASRIGDSMGVVVVLALVGSVVALAAPARATTDDSRATAAPAGKCPGEPIKLASITSTAAFPDIPAGLRAAVKAVNAKCELGRPLKLVVCDDHNDTNTGADCATKAVAAQVLAEVTSLSIVFDASQQILTQNNIPLYANGMFLATQLTSSLSFPLGSTVVEVFGHASTAKALGAKSFVLVGPERVSVLNNLVKGQNRDTGLEVGDPVAVPTSATDLSPVAAQLASSNADAIALYDPHGVQILKALIDQDFDFDKKIVTLPNESMPDALITKFGKKLDGAYLVGTTARTGDTNNPGIAQYRKEMKAARETELNAHGVLAWAGIHELVDILKGMPTVDSASLVEKLKTSKVNRPELAPVDWTTPAFPDDPDLNNFRLFERKIEVYKVVNGKAKLISPGFVDTTTAYELKR
jgi:ABC-type branched-subunit amino acid transport system substrate-binding protein